jgi:hypothetical protein
MNEQGNGNAARMQPTRAITNSSRNMGIYVLGGKGTGKSWVLSLVIALQDFLAKRPQVIFVPSGSTGRYFLHKLVNILSYLPQAEREKLWERVCYIDMHATYGFACPFPLYYKLGSESLLEVAERYLSVIQLTNPTLATSAPVTWPSTRRIGVHAGTALATLGYQITEAEDLLMHTLEWERSGRFEAAIRRYPEAVPAVSYFRNQYIPLSRTEKSRVTATFLDHIFPMISDPNLQAIFSGSSLGITWQDVAKKEQTVILDFGRVTDPETKRFALLWTFSHLYEFIK